MKKSLGFAGAVALLLFSLPSVAQHKLEQRWLTADLPTPESVLYVAHKKSPYLFVSLIDGQGDGVDGKGGVAKLATDGSIVDKNWVTGLNAPKGMAIHKNRLYVSDITELVVIDIKKQRVIKKIPIEGSVFLNDVAVNSKGEVFVSDTRTNKVHKVVKDVPEIYLENVASANGLAIIGGGLVVGAGKELLLVDSNKKSRVLATGFAQGIDGIEPLSKQGDFIVSCWPGLVYYVYSDGKTEQLIDSQEAKINTADIGYDPTTQQVFVPNFFKNSVTAYQLK